MFTGIVEACEKILEIQNGEQKKTFSIEKPKNFLDIQLGDSISVNGVCLTVVELTETQFKFDAVGVTLTLTNLGDLRPGDYVNLERALSASGRFGGHYVQGHVDTTAVIQHIEIQEAFWLVTFQISEDFKKYLISKAFIALDGMSLTVVSVDDDTFKIMLIPHTRAVTITKFYQRHQRVNIEIDILAKYANHTSKYSFSF